MTNSTITTRFCPLGPDALAFELQSDSEIAQLCHVPVATALAAGERVAP
ncbi:MAG: hypothetical protein QF903_04375 [Planctomycetota bacterium]|jgi:hypothetical protein|nr:hypothetical protein [Planctomycetota bacterium]MDP6764347.1 hypothetical protein [Planctomycetota bacterium]MDP6988693.1 hypothetical protein [Planctomycetota bacterium]